MNLDKIIAELRIEVQSIDEAILALQRLLPANAEEREQSRPRPKKDKER